MDQIKMGKFIAALRKEKGLTQEKLGERLGVTNKTVSRWERFAWKCCHCCPKNSV